MPNMQKEEIKNKETLNKLDYEYLEIENSQLTTSLQECKSKLKERVARETEKESRYFLLISLQLKRLMIYQRKIRNAPAVIRNVRL